VGGTGRLRLEAPVRYDLNLNATGVQLAAIARHNRVGPEAEFTGTATAQLFLSSHGPDDAVEAEPRLHGTGSIDITNAKIARLHLMLDLLKWMNLQAPDRTAFDEAHALFRLRGEQVDVTQLDLLGNAISVGGQGGLKLDGSQARFELYAVWSRLWQMLPGPLADVPATLSKCLSKIEMTGTVGGKWHYQLHPVPILVDPVKRIVERMRKRK
jgi:hypothetical protein